MAKKKFDLGAVKRWLFEHGEKLVFGLVVLAFLGFTYSAVSREVLDSAKQPDKLREKTEALQRHVQNSPWAPSDDVYLVDFSTYVQRQPVDVKDFNLTTPFNPALADDRIKRARPKILTAVQPHAVYGFGSFAVKPVGVNNQNPNQGNFNPNNRNNGRPRRNHGYQPPREADLKQVSWVVVTALVPRKAQEDEYRRVFEPAMDYKESRDRPHYSHWILERAEIVSGDTADLEWKEIPSSKEFEGTWLGNLNDTVDRQYLEQKLVAELGPLVGFDWPEHDVVHPAIREDIARLLEERNNPNRGRGGRPDEPRAVAQAPPPSGSGSIPAETRTLLEEAFASQDRDQIRNVMEQLRSSGANQQELMQMMQEVSGGQMGGRGGPGGGGRGGRGGGGGGPGGGGFGPGGGGPGGGGPGGGGGGRGGRGGGGGGNQPRREWEVVQDNPPAFAGRGGGGNPMQMRMDGGNGPWNNGPQGSADQGGSDRRRRNDYKMLRAFDFTVEPHKKYRYRLKLVLDNPNHRVKPYMLEDPKDSNVADLASEPSEPSQVVTAGGVQRLIAGTEPTPKANTADPVATVMVTAYDKNEGIEGGLTLEVSRGQLANIPKSKISDVKARDPRNGQNVELNALDLRSDNVILDIRGGRKVTRKASTLLSPEVVLVLDADGNMTVRSELADERMFEDRQVQDDPPPQPQRGNQNIPGRGNQPNQGRGNQQNQGRGNQQNQGRGNQQNQGRGNNNNQNNRGNNGMNQNNNNNNRNNNNGGNNNRNNNGGGGQNRNNGGGNSGGRRG